MTNIESIYRFDQINSSLEEYSWYVQENFLDDEMCNNISNLFLQKHKDGHFLCAKIGRSLKKSKVPSIRNGEIMWISDWEEHSFLSSLSTVLTDIMLSINSHFRVSLKRFESQFSIYEKGGFYKIHLDQHRDTRHRQISCCLYLNDCEEGGELILYKKGSRSQVEKVIRPKRGTCVLFFSADIFHEVKHVNAPRHSITTWFRDDELLPF